jgi:hypothetical protein
VFRLDLVKLQLELLAVLGVIAQRLVQFRLPFLVRPPDGIRCSRLIAMARTGDGDTFSGSPATSDAQFSAVSADGRIRSSTSWIQADSVSAVVVIAASTSVFFSAAVCSAPLHAACPASPSAR